MRTLVQGILREANVQLLGGEEQTTSYAEFTAYEQLLGAQAPAGAEHPAHPARIQAAGGAGDDVSGAADHGRDVCADLHRHPAPA